MPYSCSSVVERLTIEPRQRGYGGNSMASANDSRRGSTLRTEARRVGTAACARRLRKRKRADLQLSWFHAAAPRGRMSLTIHQASRWDSGTEVGRACSDEPNHPLGKPVGFSRRGAAVCSSFERNNHRASQWHLTAAPSPSTARPGRSAARRPARENRPRGPR